MILKKNNEEEYIDECKHQKFVSRKHFIHEIEVHHPLSIKYKTYWKEMKRRTMEGYWFEGKWMPGVLYEYVNFSRIRVNKDKYSKTKIVSRPALRDLEWEKAYVFTEARGFSGFADDDVYTCYTPVANYDKLDEYEKADVDERMSPYARKKDGTLKKFVPAREYLRKIHLMNLGKPIYHNEARNVIDIECFAPETLVKLFTGESVRIDSLSVGDLLLGPDSKPRTVKSISKGFGEMYEIDSKRLGTQKVNSKHIVPLEKRVFTNGKYENKKRLPGTWTVSKTEISVEELIKIQHQPSFTNNYFIYQSPLIERDEAVQEIDPYVLGLWLADGRSNGPYITTTDFQLVEKITSIYVDSTWYSTETPKGHKLRYDVQFGNRRSILNNMGILHNKRIPVNYFQASSKQRLELLAGIIDGDGGLDQGCYTITVGLDEKLGEDYVELARSLGFNSTLTYRDRSGYKRQYTVRVGGAIHTIPVVLDRKKTGKINRRLDFTKSSFNIKPIGLGEFIGVEVDEDNLFLLDNYVVAHNCRGTGKSYTIGNFVKNTYLNDGCYDFDEFVAAEKAGTPFSVEVMVGAIDGKYTKDLLDKIQLSFDYFPGGQTVNGIYYPPPLLKESTGSWYSGKNYIENRYQVKQANGEWETRGTGSKIYNRAFADSEGGNGMRMSLGVIEEVGFFNILEDALASMKDTTKDGTVKFGTIWMAGTGGQMESGKSESAKAVFNDPEAYDCLSFNDIWEETGSIGFFVPYEMGLNQFKSDDEGITDMVAATRFADGVRKKLQAGKSKRPLYKEMQNNPRVPSEAFLTQGGNIFPTAELKDHLNWVKSKQDDGFIKGQLGELAYVHVGDKTELQWIPDLKGKLSPCFYGMKKTDDTQGCIQIWEHPTIGPDGRPPFGLYIAGTDPYDQDKAPNSVSLGSTIIYKTFSTDGGTYEWPVAEYTARPGTAKEHHETVKRLLLYYNARCLYENERNTIKMHFEQTNSLYLLAKTPTILKATQNTKVDRTYGIHMTDVIKAELEIYLRDWLITPTGDGQMNLHKIYSIPILEELVNYNEKGNFDRIIALLLVILKRLQDFRIKVESVKEESKVVDSFFTRQFFR